MATAYLYNSFPVMLVAEKIALHTENQLVNMRRKHNGLVYNIVFHTDNNSRICVCGLHKNYCYNNPSDSIVLLI